MVDSLVLWAAPGACSRISLVALLHCGETFRLAGVALQRGEQLRPAYLALNPKGKVPLLQTPHGPLSETLAIVCWLEQLHPHAGLLPEAAWPRAQALSWLAFVNAGLHPLLYRARMPQRIHGEAGAHAGVREAALQELRTQLQVAEDTLADGREWLVGPRWCMADEALGWLWSRALQSGLEPGPFPAVAALATRLAAQPTHQEALRAEAELH
ncbi:MAG TPA: glutathione S-transferase family protein [Roseateles sp.]